MREARGRLHGSNVGGNFGAEGVNDIVGIGGGHQFRGTRQTEVGVGGWSDRVTAAATGIPVSEMQNIRWKRDGVPL